MPNPKKMASTVLVVGVLAAGAISVGILGRGVVHLPFSPSAPMAQTPHDLQAPASGHGPMAIPAQPLTQPRAPTSAPPTAQISPPTPAQSTPQPTPGPQAAPPCAARHGPAPVPPPSGGKFDVPNYGGEPISVGRGYLEGEAPSYAPDGRAIAFVRFLDYEHIWTIGVDGRNLRKLSPGHNIDSFSRPVWSPDGTQIAFTILKDRVDAIWVIRPDGSNLTRLTTEIAGRDPAWSPDASQIAYASREEGSRDIWLMNADGTHPRRVTNLSQQLGVSSPAFSPDGRQIVFMAFLESVRGNSPSKLMIVNADGTGLCQLTTDETFHDGNPHWSQRGIVFDSDRNQYGHWIGIVQPDGSGLEPLPVTSGEYPVWSPDGNRIAFVDQEHLFVFNFVDHTTKPLTQLNVLPLVIYIKPGLSNTIDSKSTYRISVAILPMPWFDPVRQLDQSSITFGPDGEGRPPVACGAEDLNQDGMPALVCQFSVASMFSPTHTEGVVRAKDVSGFIYEGRDAVRVLSP